MGEVEHYVPSTHMDISHFYGMRPCRHYGPACVSRTNLAIEWLGERSIPFPKAVADYWENPERWGDGGEWMIRLGIAGIGFTAGLPDGSGNGCGGYPSLTGGTFRFDGDGSMFDGEYGAGKGCPFNRRRGNGREDQMLQGTS